jgi:hypothetical protein
MPLIRCAIFLHPFDAELLHFLRRVDINGRGEGPVYETKALIFLALASIGIRLAILGILFHWHAAALAKPVIMKDEAAV